jgi:Ca2+-binding EF-hand superfamily protein
MRYFFRAFNLSEKVADRFYACVAGVTNSKGVSSHALAECLSPYLDSQTASLPKLGPSLGALAPERRASVGSTGDVRDEPEVAPSNTTWLEREKQNRELELLLTDIATKLPLKFRHPRDAFRMLDLERNGWITRSEMRGFFRGFGHSEEVADRIFGLLHEPGRQEVDFKDFMRHFDGILGPAFRQSRRDPLIPCKDRHVESEVNKVATIILDRLITKYRNVHDAFRALDLNSDGMINQEEMRHFIRSFGMGVDTADNIFAALDADDSGGIQYDEFIELFKLYGENKKESEGEPVRKAPPLRRLF